MTEPTGPRIAICVPSHDQIAATFAFDLANMMAYTSATLVADGVLDSIGLLTVQNTYIHTARQTLARAAQTANADFLLWLDSDMRFPKDLLVRLLRHDREFVGINYAHRGVPPGFVAIKQRHPPVKLRTDEQSAGLEEVEAVGFGAVLMRRTVLDRLPDPKVTPWFHFVWDAERGQQVGEDVYFCGLARDHGATVYVDHDTSKLCAHTGTFEYRLDHVLAAEEQDATNH